MRGVDIAFGGVQALRGADLAVGRGEIAGLIGPNGAGKTTLFNCVTGVHRPGAGAIDFDGRSLLDVPSHAVVEAGIARTFQNLGLYDALTVGENVQVGGHARFPSRSFFAPLAAPRREREAERRSRAAARACLDMVGIGALADRPTRGLPYGTLKRVELARALMSEPRLLLLDEPAGGLAHAEVDELAALLRRLVAERALTLLLVEHHMRLVMGLCDRVTVLHLGATLAAGTPREVRDDPRVAAAYLGASTPSPRARGAGRGEGSMPANTLAPALSRERERERGLR